MRISSLRTRLLLALVAALAAAALLIGGITYRNVLAETEALFDYQLRQMALSLRDQGEIAPDQAQALADEQLDFVIQIWTADGRSIYAPREHDELPARALLGLADVRAGGRTWRTFSVATRDRVIQVAQPVQIRQRLAAGAALRTVAPLLLLAPLLALAVGWIALHALAPLRRVSDALRQRDAQSLAPLPADGLPDELAPLVSGLNGLLDRLARSLELQRAFVADAAHELRSPLTALKLQLQLIRRAPDDAARADAIQALGEGIDRAVRLVEQLLTLARSEHGGQAGAGAASASGASGGPRGAGGAGGTGGASGTGGTGGASGAGGTSGTSSGAAAAPGETRVLSELGREAVAATAPQALARGTDLELYADTPVRVRGDRPALLALARNLADNAVRYAPPGARVELRVFDDAGAALLQVDDAGPGIPADERDRVFDRFYRRAVNDEGGSGLGLAIVRSVADRHGATVALADSPLGGLRVTVRFPAAAAVLAAPAPTVSPSR